ncbi:hypothetical protein GCM10020229_60000 [Kitasatospora albolonga]
MTRVSPGWSRTSRITCGTEAASPPVITWRRWVKVPGYSSSRKFSRLAEACRVVTRWRATSSAIRAGSGRWPGWRTQVPPESSGPNSSRAKASQETGEHWSQVCAGSREAKSCPSRVPTIARCGESTPLGAPVEPEVNIRQAASSGRAGSGRAVAGCSVVGCCGAPSTSSCGASIRSASAARVRIRSVLAARVLSRSTGNSGSSTV